MRMVTERLVSVTVDRVDAILFMSHLRSSTLYCGFAGVALLVYISKRSAYTCHKSGFSLMPRSRSSRLQLQLILLLIILRLGPRAHLSGEGEVTSVRIPKQGKGRSMNIIAS
jgi:hypothetical protein